jgi:amino acid adenylation domain-containing protein/thioester reductase-like protein
MVNQIIEGFRLSPQQKKIYFLQKKDNLYCAQATILIEGKLNLQILKITINKVVNRHEILRTSFQKLSGIKIPIQVVNDSYVPTWYTVNLDDCDELEKSIKIKLLLQEEKRLFSELTENHLWRLSLIHLSDEKHILVITLSSLYADSWTIKNLLSEISQAYIFSLKGEDLTDEVIQYIQFSEWQNQLLEEEEAEQGKEYWQKSSLNCKSLLVLPGEENNPVEIQLQPEIYSFNISPDVALKISQITAKYNVKIPHFFQACWQTLIWRLTKESNIVINTVIDGRKYPELHDLMGLLAKSLPVNCLFSKDLKFGEILAQIAETLHEHDKWQEYFIWDENTLNSLPISFEYAELPDKYTSGNISFSLYNQYVYFEAFKLKLLCLQQGNSVILELHYNGNIFSRETIQRLAGQLENIITSGVDNPEATVSDLEILSKRDRHQLLVEWNNTLLNYPQDKTIHQLFEEQVEKTPHNIATLYENQHLTYAELNAKANQLANYLKHLKVTSETIVGLYVERSLDSIIGLLGILKAGAAYLPLDAALPPDALAIRLQDVKLSVLLTQESLVKKLPQTSTQLVLLDADWQNIRLENPANLPTSAKPENLVYAILTSGSTGKPKVVAVEHRQLVNYLYGIVEQLNLPSPANFACFSTFAADLGNTVIFPALCTGGCLHIISQERLSNPHALAEYFQRHPIDCLKIVPSHLSALLTSSPTLSLLPRQRLILGGEASNWELIEQIQQQTKDCQIFNHYGPTETTVGVLTYFIDNTKTSHNTQIPLGKPLPNTQIYILDEQLQPVPIGVSGELYIAGAGVARGYLNQPELTAERFIKNPFSCEPNARLYKTGDLARYLSDGNIEFLGRIDNQVKIRGFRIELGEIESVLRQHSAVQDVVVLATQQKCTNKQLVAYLVPQAKLRFNQHQNTTLIGELRSFVKQKLPEYMMPSVFILLKALPLTSNGKIDYQALPAPEQTRSQLEQIYVAPRTSLEAQLADIWAKLLDIEQVGIHDNFFELGGHSLLITQLLAKVRNTFGVEMPLRDLFDAPTIADLAQRIQNRQETNVLSKPSLKINLDAEAILDPAIYPANKLIKNHPNPHSIFLTGATGFLGAFLLYELLQQTAANIYCLVRATDIKTAKHRLQNNLNSYLLWDESYNQRIIPVVGDLSRSLLGLSNEQFSDLAGRIDVIYHNGALVNFTYPYSALKSANVLGTQEVLRLAAQTQVKPVHFVSTIAVTQDKTSLDSQDAVASGYTQSKWVAEKLVTIAGDRQIPISIYRLGRISGHSQTGVCNANDHTFRMIRGCIQLSRVPKQEMIVNLTSVDYATQAIVHLSRQTASLGKAFNILNPQSLHWNELVSLIQSYGYPLRQISPEEWRSELINLVENNPNHPLYPLISLFGETDSIATNGEDSHSYNFNCENTISGLSGTSITCPPLNNILLNTYFSYLIQNGLLPIPHTD